MNSIKWLHISDLHFGNEDPQFIEMRNSFLEFANKQLNTVDYLFITGDISFKGPTKKNYDDAKDYLNQLATILWPKDNARLKRIFIVPGNHDLERSVVRTNSIKTLFSTAQDIDIDISYLKSSAQSLEFFWDFLLCYRDVEEINKAKESSHYIVETDDLIIIHINTCLLSCMDEEEGKLLICQDSLKSVLSNIKGTNKFAIAIGHHSPDCLEYKERKHFEKLLKDNNVGIYLCGHSHERESNIILNVDQTKPLYVYTCGTFMPRIKSKNKFDTIVYSGTLDLVSNSGSVLAYEWKVDEGWSDDSHFGSVQHKTNSNCRTYDLSPLVAKSNTKVTVQGLMAQLVTHDAATRHEAFLEINEQAKSRLDIYGVGITSVTQTCEKIEALVKKGGNVRLCMVDPIVFMEESQCSVESICGINSKNFCILGQHLNEYYKRDDYYFNLVKSYERLKELVKKCKEKNYRGNVEARILKSFIPISINIVNSGGNGQLIVENSMPFTDKRLLIHLKKRDAKEYFATIVTFFETIWETAEVL